MQNNSHVLHMSSEDKYSGNSEFAKYACSQLYYTVLAVVHLQCADECIQRWEETLTSVIAIVDWVNAVPHPLLYLQRIKKDALSLTYDMVNEFILRKEIDLIQKEEAF